MINTYNVLDILENTAKRIPDKIVFEDEETMISYSDFVKKAKIAGTGLSGCFVENNPVPIFMEKSVQTLQVMFGAIYAGCFYVIIDIHHPLARINQIMQTLQSDKMVTSEKYADILQKTGYEGEIILIEDIIKDNAIDETKLMSIRNRLEKRSPLYCNFTSGSTGTPKGVLVGQESVIDFIENFVEIFNIKEKDIIGNQAPFDFDVSVKDIYSTIFTGARMVIIPKRKFSFPTELMDYLCEKEITTLVWAVSALCIISTLNGFSYKIPDKINKVIFSGEVMPVKHLNIWRKYIPDALYVNVYGPTEITCNCTYYIIEKDEMLNDSEKIPIGKAFPNEKVFLLNENKKLVDEKRCEGEICVSGICLALEYYNDKVQTEKAFVKCPLENMQNGIMYTTGDIGYYDENGNLYYSGRKDFQIKHMGHRIELGEIEQAIGNLDGIDRVNVIFDKDGNNIVAFYKGTTDKREIKKSLRKTLPVFMIPNKFAMVEEFPLNKNGKTDRKKLLSDWIEEEKRIAKEKKMRLQETGGRD